MNPAAFFAIVFIVAMAAVFAFAFFISQRVDHGEARFDTSRSEGDDASEDS
ncbi:hypothetical protein BPTFM16_00245 [Altererythrobacter insulae]|nr:hypothetical protein BPTFM16_00245 [Altererythrobacter insulae]